MEATSKKRPPFFKISIPGDEEKKSLILALLNDVREVLVRQLDHPVNNADIIEKVLKTFLEKSEGNTCNQERTETLDFNTYIQVPEKETEQKIFLTAETSLERLVKVVENHAKVCDGSLNCKKVNEKGLVVAVRFNCSSNKSHSLLWSSSPYLPNNEYLVNRRVMHGFACSGMLPVHYARFVKGANIGFIHQKNRDKCLQIMHSKIEEEYRESIEMALWGEVGCQNEDEDGISIMTDARHEKI